MNIFKEYASNTLASNGNQTVFTPFGTEQGMVFIKPTVFGRFPLVFGFSSVIDSTFADGSRSCSNDVCESWAITCAGIAAANEANPEMAENLSFMPLTFNGSPLDEMNGRDFVFTDPVEFEAKPGQYYCLKFSFTGAKVPCHFETIIPVFKKINNAWISCPEVPLPVFTGIKRPVECRVGFLGDSITQGIGTPQDSYTHCAAVIAEKLGENIACWDLGIGFARGADAATDGIWLKKAARNDIVTVCYGVNDMFQGRTPAQIKADLERIIDLLHSAGVKVIIQTVPPFDYGEEHEKMWREVNAFIRNELSQKADAFFDTVPVLGKGEDSPASAFGPHPNAEGNRLWAERLYPVIKKQILLLTEQND